MRKYLKYGGYLLFLIFIIIAGFLAFRITSTIGAVQSFFSFAATPTPSPIVVTIASITPLSELATVDYKAMADVENERIPNFIYQHLGIKEKIIMLVYGDVKAGFDLSTLTDNDLLVKDKRVRLVLPPPKILSTSIDYDHSRILSYKKSFFLKNDPALEKETFGLAQDALTQAALDADVLKMARQYGQLFFENHLRSLGFEDVEVIIQ